MKWYTITQYVDQQTGEILTKEQVEKHYIIIKKIKRNEYKEQWGRPNWSGTRTLERYGVRTIKNVCTTEGKQQRLWEDA